MLSLSALVQDESSSPLIDEQTLLAVKGFVMLYGIKILAAVATFVIGRMIARFLTGAVRRLIGRADVDPTLANFLGNLTYMLLLTVVIVATVGKLGVETASFVAILGAAGFAVGFAMQGSLANFAAGVMIMIFKPFKVGDFVEAGGTSGVIVEVGIFATIMKTADNKKVIVANAGVTGGNIVNYSANDTRRVDMLFGIGYGDDIKKARETLEKILNGDDRVLKDPAPKIAISELADSSVNFVCRPWVKTADYWDVFFDTHEAVKLRFDELGISIPYPQQDVHMHQVA